VQLCLQDILKAFDGFLIALCFVVVGCILFCWSGLMLCMGLLQIFKTYIEIELQLGNINRCRTLYEKYLEWAPANCYAWSKFAELEKSLNETDRGRSIFEIAIAQPVLDMPELLWKV